MPRPRRGKGLVAEGKTTVYIDQDLSDRVKLRAKEERTSFNALVIEGLEMILASGPKVRQPAMKAKRGTNK